MTYAEAAKALKKIGCSRAKGDALRAMYAQLLLDVTHYHKRVLPKFYAHFQGFDGARNIRKEFQRLEADPFGPIDLL